MILHIELKDNILVLWWTETNEADIREECLKYPDSPYVIYEDDGVTVIEAGDKLSNVF